MRDRRLSGVLHVLLHMAEKEAPATSGELAKAMDTNPVVLRRAMAGLRDQGYVQSEKGHGGGWTLACDLAQVTLHDIYTALGSPSLFAIGNRTESPGCVVEQAVNAALSKSFQDAESLLLSRLGEITLAGLSKDVRRRLAARHPAHRALPHSHPHHGSGEHHHGFAHARALSLRLDDPERDTWQRPDDLLRALKLDPNMTVADVGAGTGYFSVRLARAVPQGHVIATDLEPNMLRFLRKRAHREKLVNLRTVQSSHSTSGLAAESVDRILVVHLWHHLEQPDAYARDLAAALRPHGKLFVVDFNLSAQRGPPAKLRVAPEAVVRTLKAAGLSARVSRTALPEQFIVEAAARAV